VEARLVVSDARAGGGCRWVLVILGHDNYPTALAWGRKEA
jgi:hypothetical protein